MPATGYVKKGDQTYDFGFEKAGLAAAFEGFGIKPTKISFGFSPEFVEEATDVNGATVSVVVAKDTHEVTVEGYLLDESTFSDTKSITYGGRKYVAVSKSLPREVRQFSKVSITARGFFKITS